MTSDRTRGDRILRAGVWITIIGLVFSVIAMLPLVLPIELPSAFWFLSMITGVGLAVIIAGFVVSGGERRRAARR